MKKIYEKVLTYFRVHLNVSGNYLRSHANNHRSLIISAISDSTFPGNEYYASGSADLAMKIYTKNAAIPIINIIVPIDSNPTQSLNKSINKSITISLR